MLKKVLAFNLLYYLAVVVYESIVRGTIPVLQVLDVGQGDAIKITTPSGKVVMIDTGPDNYVSSYLTFPTCRIDFLILTHFHADHTGGVQRIMKNCEVMIARINDVSLVKNLNVKIDQKYANNSKKFTDSIFNFELEKLRFLILDSGAKSTIDANESSLTVFVKYRSFLGVFAGDSPYAATLTTLNSDKYRQFNTPPATNVLLVVPHHGSKTGISKALLAQLKPKTCVVSVGQNTYGHPNPDILELLASSGCKVLRTDKSGTLEFKIK